MTQVREPSISGDSEEELPMRVPEADLSEDGQN